MFSEVIKHMNTNKSLSKDGSKIVTDEKFNASSHLSAALFSIIGISLLIVYSSVAGKIWHIVSFSIYGMTLFAVFVSSALHHGVNSGPKLEKILKLCDYLAIFLLIAGTYTPICLVPLRGPMGWTIFGATWGMAAIGITIKSIYPDIPKWVTNTIYITMGWAGGVIVFKLIKTMSLFSVSLIALGGIFYSIGMLIFYAEKPNPFPGKFAFHEIWHIFVILGALSHFLFMWFYILPN